MTDSRSRQRWPKSLAAGIIAISALVVGAGAVLTTTRAVAVFQDITETGHPGYLVLSVNSSTPMWTTLVPGGTARWLVQASLLDATSGDLSLELQIHDPLSEMHDLSAEVVACSGSFTLTGPQPSCSGDIEVVLQETALALIAPGVGPVELAPLHSDAPRQLLVTLSLASHASALPPSGASLARIGLGVHVEGDSPAPMPPPETDLPVTGQDILPLMVLALGLIGLGSGIVLRRIAQGRARVQT